MTNYSFFRLTLASFVFSFSALGVAAPAATDLYTSEQLRLGFEACADLFPSKKVERFKVLPSGHKPRYLCADQFAVAHSGLAKSPFFVVEKLNRSTIVSAKNQERAEQFFPDPRLPNSERSALSDFKGSSFDRGHLAASANQATPRAREQSNSLTNIIMQDPQNNRGDWRKIEEDTRKYILRAKGDVFVISGAIFPSPPTTIGRNKVWVASHLYKVVFDADSKKAWAYILQNKDVSQSLKPVPYEQAVRILGIDFLQGEL